MEYCRVLEEIRRQLQNPEKERGLVALEFFFKEISKGSYHCKSPALRYTGYNASHCTSIRVEWHAQFLSVLKMFHRVIQRLMFPGIR